MRKLHLPWFPDDFRRTVSYPRKGCRPGRSGQSPANSRISQSAAILLVAAVLALRAGLVLFLRSLDFTRVGATFRLAHEFHADRRRPAVPARCRDPRRGAPPLRRRQGSADRLAARPYRSALVCRGRAVSRSGDALRRARPLHFSHALQPGDRPGGARHPAADGRGARNSIRARSGGSSPKTIISSAARRRGCGSTTSSRRSSVSRSGSRRQRRRLFRPHQRGARDAGVSSARALRALQHRGDRDDRQPARSACSTTRRSGTPAGAAASSRPIGRTRSSIPISTVFAATWSDLARSPGAIR